MKFAFHIQNVAHNNSQPAKLREATRMACIAHALDARGHNVTFASVPPVLTQSNRWQFFSHIPVRKMAGALAVHPAEALLDRHTDIAIKCSVNVQRDATWQGHSRLLVAHEFSPDLNDEGVLHVPFLVHDRVIDDLIDRRLFGAYLDDDLDTIRAELPQHKEKWVGFCGAAWGNRREFFHDAPDWVHIRFYNTHLMSGWEHACWLANHRGAVCLRGDTPKTNLPPLCALLGIPIVAVEPERNTPSLDLRSMIRFANWDGVRSILAQDTLAAKIAENATEIYKRGWSPLGIARQIVERLK